MTSTRCRSMLRRTGQTFDATTDSRASIGLARVNEFSSRSRSGSTGARCRSFTSLLLCFLLFSRLMGQVGQVLESIETNSRTVFSQGGVREKEMCSTVSYLPKPRPTCPVRPNRGEGSHHPALETHSVAGRQPGSDWQFGVTHQQQELVWESNRQQRWSQAKGSAGGLSLTRTAPRMLAAHWLGAMFIGLGSRLPLSRKPSTSRPWTITPKKVLRRAIVAT